MIKYTIIVIGLFYCGLAYGEGIIPIRKTFLDGSPIPKQDIKLIHRKDTDPNGWRFNTGEWRQIENGMPIEPRYRNNVPGHGSNGGWSLA